MNDDGVRRDAGPAQVSDRAILLIVVAYAAVFIAVRLCRGRPCRRRPRPRSRSSCRARHPPHRLLRHRRDRRRLRECRAADPMCMSRLLQVGRENEWRSGRGPLSDARFRAVREEPAERLVHRPWLRAVFPVQGRTFATHINSAFFGLALAPIFSEILFSTSLTPAVSVPLAIATSLAIGFILPPAAAPFFKAHMGFSLYNMGFTAGLVGTLVVALYKSYGFVPDPFSSGRPGQLLLGVFLSVVFASMIAVGFCFDRRLLSGLRKVIGTSGQLPTDFIALAGIGPTLANMGLTARSAWPTSSPSAAN